MQRNLPCVKLKFFPGPEYGAPGEKFSFPWLSMRALSTSIARFLSLACFNWFLMSHDANPGRGAMLQLPGPQPFVPAAGVTGLHMVFRKEGGGAAERFSQPTT